MGFDGELSVFRQLGGLRRLRKITLTVPSRSHGAGEQFDVAV